MDDSGSSNQKGFHPNQIWATPKCMTRQDGDLGMPRVAHVAAVLVGCSPLSENLVRTTLSLPRLLHWLNTFCCTWQRWTFLSYMGSQSSRLQVADIYQGRHLLRMDKNSTLTRLTFPAAEEAIQSVAPIYRMEEHHCFFIGILTTPWIAICRKWVPTPKLTKSSSSRSAGKCSIARATKLCVHGSDYHFAKTLCTMRSVEHNARIYFLMGTWLDILDIIHVIMCGDDHFILCADEHLFASFESLHACTRTDSKTVNLCQHYSSGQPTSSPEYALVQSRVVSA